MSSAVLNLFKLILDPMACVLILFCAKSKFCNNIAKACGGKVCCNTPKSA
eukprot:06132.XXX_36013_36162_1 [CDS] Oithona nana genome sequencing.